MVKLGVKKLDPNAKLPTKAYPTDSGYDLYSNQEYELFPEETEKIKTGISFQIPDGYEVQIRSRSGMALNGIVVANSPGTIDQTYTGEIMIILRNNNIELSQTIKVGQKIAQAVLAPVVKSEIEEIEELPETERGSNGFGSSGKF